MTLLAGWRRSGVVCAAPGQLGVIRAAAQTGLLDLDLALDKLSLTNFYIPTRLVAFLRAEARARKSGG